MSRVKGTYQSEYDEFQILVLTSKRILRTLIMFKEENTTEIVLPTKQRFDRLSANSQLPARLRHCLRHRLWESATVGIMRLSLLQLHQAVSSAE